MRRAEQAYIEARVENADVQNDFATDPKGTIRKLLAEAQAHHPLNTDPTVYRIVVSFLGLIVILFGSFYGYLVYKGLETPDAFIALSSTALGALAGLLAPSPKSEK